VHRLAVGDEDVLEGQLEQRAERGQDALAVPWGVPDPEHAVGRGEAVGEDEGPLLGQYSGVSCSSRPS
jgi:hypothetical protein